MRRKSVNLALSIILFLIFLFLDTIFYCGGMFVVLSSIRYYKKFKLTPLLFLGAFYLSLILVDLIIDFPLLVSVVIMTKMDIIAKNATISSVAYLVLMAETYILYAVIASKYIYPPVDKIFLILGF